MRRARWVLTFLVVWTAVLLLTANSFAGDAKRISKEDVQSMLGGPDLVLIDVRTSRDWRASDAKIKDASREDPGKADEWAGKYAKDQVIVLYCA